MYLIIPEYTVKLSKINSRVNAKQRYLVFLVSIIRSMEIRHAAEKVVKILEKCITDSSTFIALKNENRDMTMRPEYAIPTLLVKNTKYHPCFLLKALREIRNPNVIRLRRARDRNFGPFESRAIRLGVRTVR
jgi:hypothetical protein